MTQAKGTGYKHPYRTAREQLANAALKLGRAKQNGNVDPVSGFHTQTILDWIVDFPELGDDGVVSLAQAVLRRHGYHEEAESFSV